MADYRCYCQDREDQIVSRYDISAPDLDAALREARWFCGIYSVEIWQGILAGKVRGSLVAASGVETADEHEADG